MKHKKIYFLIRIAFVIILNLELIRAQLHWDKIVDNLSYQLSSKPAPRRDSAIGHDRERNRVILFGGWQQLNENVPTISIPVLFDDTWEFNLETKLWRKLTFSLIRPAPRYGMTYTHNRYGLYISCGRGWLDEYYDDLWMYDFREDQWYKMDQTHISIVPEQRYGAFGGLYPSYEYSNEIKTNLYLAHGRNEIVMHENMYVYSFTDLRGLNGVWEKIYTDFLAGPFGYNYPHARMFASSTMISPDELIIFGGCLSGGMTGGPCPSSDSWIYSYVSNRWEKIDSSNIAPRMYSSMASILSDGYRKSAILFSGLNKDKTIISVEEDRDDEIAVYDNLANKWILKRVMGFYFPEKRNGHVMCTGRYRDQYGVFMFGGYGESSETNLADLWFLQANISTLFQPTFVPTNNEINKWSHYFSTIHLHAIFMFVGWAIFININMLIKRYKSYTKDRKSKILNAFEKLTELFGILIISGGILLGFYSTHGLSNLVHAFVGLSAYVLILLQPFTGFLIDRFTKIDYYIENKDGKQKTKLTDSILNLIYKNTGYTAILFAAINISLGVFYAVFHWVWILVWFSFLVASIIVYIGFEIKIYLNYSKNITQSTIPHTSEYDDNINLNESRTNLSLSSHNTHLSENKYPLSYTTSTNNLSHQVRYQNNKESSFTTINSFSPQIKLDQFDPNSYQKSLKNEKKILNKIQQRSNELHSMNNSIASNSRRGIINVNENFQDDVVNYSNTQLTNGTQQQQTSFNNNINDLKLNRNLKQNTKFFNSTANLRY